MPKVLIGMDIDAAWEVRPRTGRDVEPLPEHVVVPSQELYTNMMDTCSRLNGFTLNVVRGRIVNEAPWKFTDKALKAKANTWRPPRSTIR